tara:strand:+ start:139 stop:381 length:243 start_codon:yes stop_codon:yes gene_type:complete
MFNDKIVLYGSVAKICRHCDRKLPPFEFNLFWALRYLAKNMFLFEFLQSGIGYACKSSKRSNFVYTDFWQIINSNRRMLL